MPQLYNLRKMNGAYGPLWSSWAEAEDFLSWCKRTGRDPTRAGMDDDAVAYFLASRRAKVPA